MQIFVIPKLSFNKKAFISLDKLHCWELYNILVYTSPHKPTSEAVCAKRGVRLHVHPPAHPKSIYAYENSDVQIIVTNIGSYAWKLSSQ